MCVHASTHSRSRIGSMNIIMWPVGHKRSESSRGVKGLAASFDVRSIRMDTPLHGCFCLDFWIVLTGKALTKACQRGPGAWQRVCRWMWLRLLSRVVRFKKKNRQRRDKGRARGKSDSLCLYRTIIRWEGVNVSHSDQNPLRIKSTSPCLIRTLITSFCCSSEPLC